MSVKMLHFLENINNDFSRYFENKAIQDANIEKEAKQIKEIIEFDHKYNLKSLRDYHNLLLDKQVNSQDIHKFLKPEYNFFKRF